MLADAKFRKTILLSRILKSFPLEGIDSSEALTFFRMYGASSTIHLCATVTNPTSL